MTNPTVMMLAVLVGAIADMFLDVPAGGLTLHISVTPAEIHRLRSVDRRVVWQFTQCFTAVNVVVDLPHGGKTYGESNGKKKTDDPVYLPIGPEMSAFDRIEIIVSVRKAMVSAMKMLRDHCRQKPLLEVVVLNHTELEISGWFDAAFVDPPTVPETFPVFRDARPDLPRSQRFFKNTAMYIWSMLSCRSRLMLHFDVDTLGLFNNRPSIGGSPARGNFVALANHILTENESVLFVRPTVCGATRPKAFVNVSTRLFLSHVGRFRKMIPLVDWADHVEDMLNVNMRRNKMVSTTLPTRPCIASSYITRVVLKNSNW